MKSRFTTPDIHQTIVARADARRPFALAVVLQATGSTPSKTGAKALIGPTGGIEGTIGGGQLEAQTQRLAADAIRSVRPLVFDFAFAGASAHDAEPICGGTVRMLIDPTAGEHRDAYAQAADARQQRERGALLTVVRNVAVPQVAVQYIPPQSVAAADNSVLNAVDLRAGLEIALASQTPQFLMRDLPGEAGKLEVLIEPLVPPPLLLIAGGGHVGQALALHASLVGFQVTVIDDRSAFADPSRYPEEVTTRCCDIAQKLAAFPAGEDTYIALVTRGHGHDQKALAACISKPAAYIGMIGSRRKVAMIFQDLLASGAATQEQLDRVHAPIGLDIGAETVPEIAVSIVAELVAVRRRKAVLHQPPAARPEESPP